MADATRRKSVRASKTFYFATVDRIGGKDVPWCVHPTREDATKFDFLSRSKVKRYEFVPLAADRRFRVFLTEWRSNFKIDQEVRKSNEARFYHAWGEADAKHGLPKSLLSIPQGFAHNYEWHYLDKEIVTREEGFAEVARLNANESASAEWPQVRCREWYVLAELGEPLKMPLTAIELAPNGVGSEVRHIEIPLRLVLPTADELARYPFTAKLKGGAA